MVNSKNNWLSYLILKSPEQEFNELTNDKLVAEVELTSMKTILKYAYGKLCKEIKDDVIANRQMLDDRLKSLESREKNSLRAKILAEYRLYTDKRKNPKLAWTEMEHHSFFKLVEDYEDL